MKKPAAARTDRPSETTAPENQNDAEQADAEQADAEQADAEKADAEHADAGDDDKEPPTKKPKVTKKPACKDDAAGLCLLCVCDRVLVCVCVCVCVGGWVVVIRCHFACRTCCASVQSHLQGGLQQVCNQDRDKGSRLRVFLILFEWCKFKPHAVILSNRIIFEIRWAAKTCRQRSSGRSSRFAGRS